IMVVIPVMFYISTKLRKKIRRSWQNVRIQQSRLNSHLNEGLQGIRITQSFSQETENADFFSGLNEDNFESWRDASKKSALFRPFVEMSNAVGTIILISFGAYLILLGEDQGGIATRTLVSFCFSIGMSWEPISRPRQIYNQLLTAMSASERTFAFLDAQPNVVEQPNRSTFIDMKGHIEFDKVQFSYDNE